MKATRTPRSCEGARYLTRGRVKDCDRSLLSLSFLVWSCARRTTIPILVKYELQKLQKKLDSGASKETKISFEKG
jgi:hypothetical protein